MVNRVGMHNTESEGGQEATAIVDQRREDDWSMPVLSGERGRLREAGKRSLI